MKEFGKCARKAEAVLRAQEVCIVASGARSEKLDARVSAWKSGAVDGGNPV